LFPPLQCVELASAIADIIRKVGYTQAEAASIIGTDQPKISALLHGKLDGISVERLFRYLVTLGRDIEIKIKQKKAKYGPGEIRVCAAA
jgi:predicted XRE-type DNA-binding protein